MDLFHDKVFGLFRNSFLCLAQKIFNQVTTLHLIHHSLVPLGFCYGWIGSALTGHGTYFAFINSFVHVVMYFYYLIAGLDPKMQKFLWWKKYLTILQIIQFFVIFVHSAQIFFLNPCNFPLDISILICSSGILFICLFSNFYLKTYKKPN